MNPLTSDNAIVSSGGARLFPGGRTGRLGGGSVPRTQVEVLAPFSVIETGLGVRIIGEVSLVPVIFRSAPSFLSPISSCVRDMDE